MSIPTSLIVVILVAAWLAVLVPMVARRREAVPETDADGSTFRVLRRASVRRRPKLRRRDELEEDDLMDDQAIDEAADEEDLHEELLDHDELDEDDLEGDEFDDVEEEAEPEPVRRRGGRGRGRRATETVATIETQTYQAEYYDSDTDTREIAYAAIAREITTRENDPELRQVKSGRGQGQDTPGDLDEARLRPVPRRPGRGGYDPDAAEIARRYRYSRRRRVAVVLLLATIAFSLAAYFFEPILWGGTAVFGLLLLAYLGYLRRQVHIEADIRERRLARLARARQIRPEYPIGRVDSPVVSAPSLTRPPRCHRRGIAAAEEIVDLEDDDPSFDDLEYYQPVTYRRASGQ